VSSRPPQRREGGGGFDGPRRRNTRDQNWDSQKRKYGGGGPRARKTEDGFGKNREMEGWQLALQNKFKPVSTEQPAKAKKKPQEK